MSRQNKVNKTNYVQAGRLTPDEIASERKRQAQVSAPGKRSERMKSSAGPTPAKQKRAPGASRARSAPEE